MKKGIIIILMGMLVGCSSQEIKKERLEQNKISYEEVKDTSENSFKEKYEKLSPVERISFYKQYGYPQDNFPKSREIEYLKAIKETRGKKEFFYSPNKKTFLEFYKDLTIRGYGDNSNYWRWTFSLSEKELTSLINRNLPLIADKRPREILTYSNGQWVRKKVGKDPIGTLKEIRVMERGKSGVIIKLMVKGSKGTYLIIKEQNVRGLLGGKYVNIYGSKGGVDKYTDKPISKGASSLPSAYFAIEKDKNVYKFYGGGYGHGVGMSQWGVYDLTNNFGYNYKEVLQRYYKGTKIIDKNKVPGLGDKIRVGIMTTGFKSLDHEKIVLTSTRHMIIHNKYINIETKNRDVVSFISKNGMINIYVNHKLKAKTRYPIKIECPKAMISVLSIKRHHRKFNYPTYRGDFEIRLSANNNHKLTLINEIDIERYLYQVLPSEMPEGFGLEALKVQAVAARTYALSDYKKNRYKNLGFHITDSTQSQVYNNLDENETSREAINATKGDILLYNNELVDAKYYSTSSGYGANADNIW